MKHMVTPNEQRSSLAKILGFDDLYFKREDLHPLGSHKGRSIPVMIDHYYKDGVRQFAISSSGNAALAAAIYVKNIPGVKLDIFIGENISQNKLSKLNIAVNDANNSGLTTSQAKVQISKEKRPLMALFHTKKSGAQSLRQSDDDIALIGYEGLAKEIAEIPNLGAIFIGTSSGTTAQALVDYFNKMKMTSSTIGADANTGTNNPVQVHIVQTTSCHPIAEEFDTDKSAKNIDSRAGRADNGASLADAIVDKTALRKKFLVPLIKKTGGTGWCATNEDISAAQKIVKENTGLDISTNSALSVAGAMLAKNSGHQIKGTVVCMICGE